MERTGQIFDGRYQLARRIGHGGMAEVYVARDRKLDKSVAVKVLSPGSAAVPKAAQRFVQEARAVSRIHHPNVVDVTDFGVADDGAAYLVMELLRGEDLAQTLACEGPLPWARVGPIALQICAALVAAHRVSVIHRDIKPSNCFRIHSAGNPDFIKVLDFGIARVVDPRIRVVEPTTAGTVLGTPEYMAPEIAAGAEAGPAADLYAVGALLYKLLTGSAPFVGDTYRAVLSKQIFEPPVPPRRRAPAREIPVAVEALILRALAKDPAERHADMVELASAIADALPQRPPVELWLAPGAGEPPLSAASPGRGRVADGERPPTVGPPLAATRTLVRAGAAWRTAPLARGRDGARGRTLVAGGLALALAGALVGLRLAAPPDSRDMLDRAGDHEQVVGSMSHEDGRAPPAGGSSVAGSTSAPAGAPLDAPDALARSSGAPEPASAPPATRDTPARDGAPGPAGARASRRGRARGFDGDGVRRELERAAASVQRCALDSDMLRGEIALRVAIGAGGAIAEVTAAPGSRRIEPGALACMRRELAQTRVEPVAGEVVVVYVI